MFIPTNILIILIYDTFMCKYIWLWDEFLSYGILFQKNEKFLGGDERGLSEYRQKGKPPHPVPHPTDQDNRSPTRRTGQPWMTVNIHALMLIR